MTGSLYGIPIVVSEALDHDTLWVVGRPVNPGDSPQLVRLIGIKMGDLDEMPMDEDDG